MADTSVNPSKATTKAETNLIDSTPDEQGASTTQEPSRGTTSETKPDTPSTTTEATKPSSTTQAPNPTTNEPAKTTQDKPDPTKQTTTAAPVTTAPATHSTTNANTQVTTKTQAPTTTVVHTTTPSITSTNSAITPVTTPSGTLTLSSSTSITSSSISPTASATPGNQNKGGVSTSLVGGIVGAVFGALLLGAVAMLFIRRRRRHARSTRASRAMDEIFAPGNKGFDHGDRGIDGADSHWDPSQIANRGQDNADYGHVAAPETAYQHQPGQYLDDGAYGYHSTPQMAAASHPGQTYSPQLSNQAFNNMTSPVMNYRDIGSPSMGMAGTSIAMNQLDQHQPSHGQNVYSNDGAADMGYHDPYAQQYHNDPHGYQAAYAYHPDENGVPHQQGEYGYQGGYYEDPHHHQQHYDAGDHAAYAPHDAQQQQGKPIPGSPSHAPQHQEAQPAYGHQEYDRQTAGHTEQQMHGGYYAHEDPNMYQNGYAAADQGYYQQDAYHQQQQKASTTTPASQEQRYPH
ncbi:hypothetical protein EC973_002765 [Apophysomyces ossiformis]|uniref:Uncharacterized protein n=1 Tax=Apophysomyces ossiformis TaxID=679940 RepID=A0A8H7BTZ7_9FUNG|nr:hypothetical protein EC973_002765 [Apophysomyces ossiformis]